MVGAAESAPSRLPASADDLLDALPRHADRTRDRGEAFTALVRREDSVSELVPSEPQGFLGAPDLCVGLRDTGERICRHVPVIGAIRLPRIPRKG
jgi:hypothetical protein